MTLTVLRPAPVLALADMIADDAAAHSIDAHLFARAAAELAGKSWAIADEWGEVLCCWGIVPTGPRDADLWFECRPALAGRMRAAVKLAQLTLRYGVQNATLTTRVFETGQPEPPGARLARLMGFSQDAERPELWTRRIA